MSPFPSPCRSNKTGFSSYTRETFASTGVPGIASALAAARRTDGASSIASTIETTVTTEKTRHREVATTSLHRLMAAPQRKHQKTSQLHEKYSVGNEGSSFAKERGFVAYFQLDQHESGTAADDEGMTSESEEDDSETSMSLGYKAKVNDESHSSDILSSSISASWYNGLELVSAEMQPKLDTPQSSNMKAAVPLTSNDIKIAIEIPDHILKDLDRRALESEQEHHHRAQRRHRVPVELQEVFLRSQAGETVDQPPASGVAFQVFSWPCNAVSTIRNAQGLQQHPHGTTDVYTAAPTMPRRRGSLSEASTINDDTMMVLDTDPTTRVCG
jgi:hypothetical protein